MTKILKIGTRGSLLAVKQAEYVKAAIEAANHGIICELVKIKTTGDHILDTPLSKIGDKGLFTKEIESRLLDREISLAVHSMKDMPTKLPEGLVIGAVPERRSPLDAFVSKNGSLFTELASGSRIATGSLRRRAQLLAMIPGLAIDEIRGNIVSRLDKLRASETLDGIILACAGIERAGFREPVPYEPLSPEQMIPAVGQGALCIEIRDNDRETSALIAPLNCRKTEVEVLCEREFLRTMEGGCQVPIAGYAVISEGRITLRAMVASLDGTEMIKDMMEAPEDRALEAGRELAERMLRAGADRILRCIYSESIERK